MLLRQNLARACYEWSALAAASAAAGCVLLWILIATGGIKLAGKDADSPMLVGQWTISAEAGAITLSKQLESLEQVDRWRRRKALVGAVDRRWHAPGLIFQYLALPGAAPQWLLRCSMAIPIIAFAIMAAFFAFKYRRIQKQLIGPASPVAVEPKRSAQKISKLD
jgi:hypothetical protein